MEYLNGEPSTETLGELSPRHAVSQGVHDAIASGVQYTIIALSALALAAIAGVDIRKLWRRAL